jgi:3-oxoacyl-(acyl-carrier-protein) synthase
VGVFGWGIVAPKSPNAEAFRKNLESAASWLSPFEAFGPNNFLVGQPSFDFDDYRDWIDQRCAPRHFQNLKDKMDWPSLYAMGAFIQALGYNPGVEKLLTSLGQQAHVYIGTGLGAVDTSYRASLALHRAQRRWDAFWAKPKNNTALADYLDGGGAPHGLPPAPETAEEDDREDALALWNAYWAQRSPQLQEYLAEAAAIDGMAVEGEVETGKLNVIRERSRSHAALQEKWGCPEPPWKVSANFIWNIHNTPASQISILAKITGMAFAPVAACSTFGVSLRLAMRAIQSGDAKIVVMGATDPPPHPLTLGSFYSARVLAAGKQVSNPLTQLQGTHVAGGAVVWIIGDMDYMTRQGFEPIGMEPMSVGVSADADHIIRPSGEGSRAALRQALAEGGAEAADIETWDLHATATPGDYNELSTLRSMLPEEVLVTARKGTFGHGMSAGGGWELTAQYMGFEAGSLFPTPLTAEALNASIRKIHTQFVFDQKRAPPAGLAGKLSMGVGGINACVISRPLEAKKQRKKATG